MSSRERAPRLAAATVILGAATWLFTPTIALWALWERSSSATLAEPAAIWAEVAAAPHTVASDADLLLTWSDPAALLAPRWTGTVQRVLVEAGADVEDGTPVCVIDNVQRLAWHTTVPLFRTIAQGDHGEDVAALNSFLKAQGLPSGDDATASTATVRGITEYAQQIGAGPSAVFDPGWIVYLPAPMTVTGVDGLAVGAPAPAAGSEIALGAGALASAILVTPAGSGSTTDPSAAVRMALSADETVRLGSARLPLSADGGVSSPDAFAAVAAAAAPGEPRLRVELLTKVPQGAHAIPLGAVASDAHGTCVARRTESAPEVVAVALALTGTGRVYVTGPLSPGDKVLVPPRGISCSADTQ